LLFEIFVSFSLLLFPLSLVIAEPDRSRPLRLGINYKLHIHPIPAALPNSLLFFPCETFHLKIYPSTKKLGEKLTIMVAKIWKFFKKKSH
jgi:hypothetical protein